MSWQHVYIAALLTLPLPIPETPPPGCYDALKEVANLIELTDARDHWGEWPYEVDWCRRWLQLLEDCPPISLAESLPPADLCAERLAFNRRLQAHWQYHASGTWQADAIRVVLDDLQWREVCWGCAAQARSGDAIRCRRLALRRLLEMTDGAGLPAHVDLGAFRPLP